VGYSLSLRKDNYLGLSFEGWAGGGMRFSRRRIVMWLEVGLQQDVVVGCAEEVRELGDSVGFARIYGMF